MTTPIDQSRARLRSLVTAGLLAAFTACGDNLAPPVDAGEVDAAADAAPDAPPDAPACFVHEYPQCGNEIYDLCVPYHGCVFYTCEGQSYGYCGPQS